MEFPALMSRDLQYCEAAPSEEALLAVLKQKPSDLILFFETASADETWSDHHLEFMRQLIDWLTVQAYQDKLSMEFCRKVAKAIQEHYTVLEKAVPTNITIKLSDRECLVNSLLLAASSDFFKDVLARQCREMESTTLSLEYASWNFFAPINAYITTGNVPDLWKKEQQELMDLLRQAMSWRVPEVSEECERVLKKFVTLENAVEMLILAQQEHWYFFKQDCIDSINNYSVDFSLGAPARERLSFEFYKFSEGALRVFRQLQLLVTDLICKETLSEQAMFGQVVKQCPKIALLDISRSHVLSEFFNDIPKDLPGINLAECAWLSQASFRKMADICPHVKQLILSSNYQLNFAAWGELVKFKNLKSLNLSKCHQISDEDFPIILKTFAEGTELILDECRKLSEKGFFELARHLPRLTHLSLAYCAITDSALLDLGSRCRALAYLNLTRCEQVTEKGVRELPKHALSLKELNLTHCRGASLVIEELRKRHPYLRIIH